MTEQLERRRDLLVICLLCLATLLPFINKPFHIDDPMYLWAAQHIRQHPLDPYGFNVNWHKVTEPMSAVMKNPPLVCYYLAAVSLVAGWSEPAMHAAMLLPAIGLAVGTWLLARRLGAAPVTAAAATMLSPATLVSATTVMVDVPMLCFYIWAIYLWMTGLERQRIAVLAAAALCAAAAALCKYFGATSIALMAAYAVIKMRRPGWWIAALLIPVALLIAYQMWTNALYGRGLLLDAAAFTTKQLFGTRHERGLQTLLIALAFTGGGALPALLLWLAAAPIRTVLFIAAGVAVTLIVLTLFPSADEAIRVERAATPAFLVQFAAFASAGATLLALSVRHVWRQRKPETITLALWVGGTFVFAALINWNVASRSLLPLVPPVAILASLAWRDQQARAGPPHRWIPATALALGGAVSIWVAAADASLARSQRDAANRIMSDHHVGAAPRVWFSGHWGLQYYMQRHGAVPLEWGQWSVARGEIIVIPSNNASPVRLPEGSSTHPLMSLEIPLLSGVATMRWNFAGFYSDIWGPLPFSFGAVEPERYAVLAADEPIFVAPTP